MFPLPRFTLIGTTTDLKSVSERLRNCFGIHCRLDYYQPEYLALIVNQMAEKMVVKIAPECALEIARHSHGTPRVAYNFLKRLRDYAQVMGHVVINQKAVKQILACDSGVQEDNINDEKDEASHWWKPWEWGEEEESQKQNK